MKNSLILAVTTFNRKDRLKKLVNSFVKNNQKAGKWLLIIADDGSADGTIEYIENLVIPNTPISLIKNNRQGVHHQFNTIVKQLEEFDFDYCFKCDDDIEFLKPGWENLYINAIKKSGYDHLCHFDPAWRPEKNLKRPVIKNGLISYCKAKDVQGAFFTLTPGVIRKVGYMDTKNFGFRGVGHIDYTIRACRAGFNDIDHPFDANKSNEYIAHQTEQYASAMNIHLQNALENDEETKKKYQLIWDDKRVYIPFNEQAPALDDKTEKQLLLRRLDDLEKEKQWYEKTYGHQPRWFIRIGKLLHILRKMFRN